MTDKYRIPGISLPEVEVAGDLDGMELVLVLENGKLKLKEARTVAQTLLSTVNGNTVLVGADGNQLNIKSSRSNIEVMGIGCSGTMSSTSLVGYTWQQVFSARSRANAARVTYYNLSATEYTVDKTTLTPSTTYTGGGATFDPTGGATPVNVTFSGGAPAVVPAGSTAAHAAIQSDWMAIAPKDRTDVADAFHLWHLRSYVANAGAAAYPYQTITNYATYPGNTASGRVWMVGFMSGDKIATPTGFNANNGVALGVNIEFKEFARTVRLASIGDSITSYAGIASSLAGSIANIADQAIALLNPTSLSYGTLFSHINCGVAQSLIQFYARLAGVITNHSPDVVVMPVWSPNSSPVTQTGLDQHNNVLLEAINSVLASGAVPILCTAGPQNSTTAAKDALRISNNAMWRTIAAGNSFLLCDFASVFDGALSGGVTQYATGMTTDGTHPNAAGQAAAAPLLAAALRRISVQS